MMIIIIIIIIIILLLLLLSYYNIIRRANQIAWITSDSKMDAVKFLLLPGWLLFCSLLQLLYLRLVYIHCFAEEYSWPLGRFLSG